MSYVYIVIEDDQQGRRVSQPADVLEPLGLRFDSRRQPDRYVMTETVPQSQQHCLGGVRGSLYGPPQKLNGEKCAVGKLFFRGFAGVMNGGQLLRTKSGCIVCALLCIYVLVADVIDGVMRRERLSEYLEQRRAGCYRNECTNFAGSAGYYASNLHFPELGNFLDNHSFSYYT